MDSLPDHRLRRLDDPISWLRDRPEMFFTDGASSPLGMALLLVSQILTLGAQSVFVRRDGSWWVVGGERGWLGRPDPGLALRAIVPLPEAGPNAMRVEVVAAAFFSAVAVGVDGDVLALAGASDLWRPWGSSLEGCEWIAFR